MRISLGEGNPGAGRPVYPVDRSPPHQRLLIYKAQCRFSLLFDLVSCLKLDIKVVRPIRQDLV